MQLWTFAVLALSLAAPALAEKKPSSSSCPSGPAWSAAEGPVAVVHLRRDGTIILPEGDFEADQIAVAFDDFGEGAWARADVIPQGADTPAGDSTCGDLPPAGADHPGAPLRFERPKGGTPRGAILSIKVYDLPRGAETKISAANLEAARARLVAALEPGERGEVRRKFLDPLLGPTQAVVGDPTPLDATVTTLEDNHLIDATIKAWNCQKSSEATSSSGLVETPLPLLPAMCDELIRTWLAQHDLLLLLKAVQGDVAGKKPAASALADRDLPKLLATLAAPPTAAKGLGKEQQCKGVDQLRWVLQESSPRLVTRAQIPLVGSKALTQTSYGRNGDDVVAAPSSIPLGYLVKNVPVGKALSVTTTNGNPVSPDFASLLALFVPSAKTAAISLGAFGDRSSLWQAPIERTKTEHPPRQPPPPPPPPPPPRSLSLFECPASQPAPPEMEPIARIESRATIFDPIGQHNSVDVLACDAATCSDDKSVRGRTTIKPEQSGHWALLAEIAASVAVDAAGGRPKGMTTIGFLGQSPPAFQPILSGGPPDQMYQLQQRVEPRNAVSTSLLLGYRTSPDWLVGFGPSLFVGSNSSLFSQWSLHAAKRIGSSVYGTFGVSVRALPVPDFYRVGDVVAVPVGAGPAVAPTVSTHQLAVFQFDVGLAIDVSGAPSAISSFGGGK